MPLIEERQFANGARGDAERRLARLVAHPHSGGFGLNPETDVSVIEQKRQLAELTANAKRLDDRYRRAVEGWQPRARTRNEGETWLKRRPPGTTVADWVGPERRLSKGENVLDAVARLERAVLFV